MKVITFSIFKGGTGKTTSSVNTAVSLARKGKKVLLVDLDQQASATRYLDLDPDGTPNLYQVYMGMKPAALAVRPTRFGVDMLTSNALPAAIEEALEPGDELKLADFLNPLKPTYGFIIVDTPPGKAMLAFNGLAAADLIIIPASAERMAVDGVADLINHVQRIMWNKFSLNHQELRILFTMYRSTTAHSPAIVANARKIWRDNADRVLVPNGLIVVHIGGAPLASAAWPSGDSTELTTLQGMKGRSPLPGASAPDRNRPCEVDRQQRQPEGDEAERYGDLEQREDEAQRGEESKHAQ